MKNAVIKWLKTALNLFIPPICLGCQKPVAPQPGVQQARFCSKCWGKMIFLSTPRCDQCADPFFEEGICLRCHQTRPFYDKTRSLFLYNESIKPLIFALKHGSAEYSGTLLGQLMGNMITHESQNYDYVVPVPLHWWRFLKRGYNQAAVLGKGVSKSCGVPLNVHLLYRKSKEDATQSGASAQERQKNVDKAFAVKNTPMQNINIKGKNIILVDDVMTTGATLNACSKRLKENGVNQILVITLAKSLKR